MGFLGLGVWTLGFRICVWGGASDFGVKQGYATLNPKFSVSGYPVSGLDFWRSELQTARKVVD